MIFIVDDDDAVRDSLRVLLECEGLEACDFPSGPRFLRDARPLDTDCLLLDINMSGMNGLALLHLLRQTGAKLPVIIMTSQTDDNTRRRALDAGAFMVIEKPFGSDELFSAIRSAGYRPQSA